MEKEFIDLGKEYQEQDKEYQEQDKDFKKALILPPHPLTNIEIQNYYKDEPTFNGVYSSDNLPKKINNVAYVVNLDEYKNIGTHWISLFVKNNEVIYFDSFGVEYVPNQIIKFIKSKDIKTNIFGIQEINSKMCGYFCIGFIAFIFAGRSLIDFTGFFSPCDF